MDFGYGSVMDLIRKKFPRLLETAQCRSMARTRGKQRLDLAGQ
jgi:hypothetical protein